MTGCGKAGDVDLNLFAGQGLVFACPAKPVFPLRELNQFRPKTFKELRRQDLAQAAQQVCLAFGFVKAYPGLIDIDNFHQIGAIHHLLRVGFQVGVKVAHPLRAQGIQALFDGRKILFPKRNGRIFKQHAVALFVFLQRLGSLLLLADIHHGGDEMQRFTGGVAAQDRAEIRPNKGAILVNIAFFETRGVLLAAEQRRQDGLNARDLFGRGQFLPGLVRQLAFGVTEHIGEGLVDIDLAARQGQGFAHIGGFENSAEFFFALTQNFFGLRALGDIIIDGHDLAGWQFVDKILAPTQQALILVGGGGVMFGDAGLPDAPESLQQGHLSDARKNFGHPAAEDFFARHFFNPFRCGIKVRKNKIKTLVNRFIDRHAAVDIVKKIAKTFFNINALFIGKLALTDIDNVAGDPHNLTILTYGPAHGLDPLLFPSNGCKGQLQIIRHPFSGAQFEGTHHFLTVLRVVARQAALEKFRRCESCLFSRKPVNVVGFLTPGHALGRHVPAPAAYPGKFLGFIEQCRILTQRFFCKLAFMGFQIQFLKGTLFFLNRPVFSNHLGDLVCQSDSDRQLFF